MKTMNCTFGPVAGKDKLGRKLPMPGQVGSLRVDRYVGMFYFVNLEWSGQSLGDNTQIYAHQPEAFQDPDNKVWDCGACYWGRPLFGYYAHDDEWVIRRQVMMLIQADIDFILFDTTNLSMHANASLKVMNILVQFQKAGWNVPKAAYYTNSEAGKRVHEIYDTVYKSGKYSDIWFMVDGKPLIIGRPEQCGEETRQFFTFRHSQWPTETMRQTGGFPWIAFERPQQVFLDANGENEVMSVSVAQHPQIRFGDSAFHGEDANRGRSYHETFHMSKNDSHEEAGLWGYNIAEQWEHAIRTDPRMVFVTGWNEWTAGVMKSRGSKRPVTFIDTASQEFSRDIEPMKGGHFDNYFMQLIDYVRRYKGAADMPEVSETKNMDMGDCFGQWDEVTPAYRGFPFFNIGRQAIGMDGQEYKTEGECNVFDTMKLARDGEFLYVYARCFSDIAPYDFTHRMNLFIRVQKAGADFDPDDYPSWEGYHFILNHESMNGEYTFLYECLGGWRWRSAETVRRHEKGKEIQAAIPLACLRLAGAKHFEIQFKWADRLEETESIEDFYLNGCTAPYGRVNYVYRT